MRGWPWAARIHVAELEADAAEDLSAIHGAAFAHTWSADDFAALLGERSVFALGLTRGTVFGRRPVGFVLVRIAADEAEILTIAVRPGHRRCGYGRRLMEEALRRLYGAGVAACFLEVDRANAAATGLYRALGFEVVGERPNYYRSGSPGDGSALVMRVQLR